MKAKRPAQRAFTLTELLVVVAIVAILAGLSWPALSRATEQGKKAQCQSNLRQLYQATMLYALDNNNTLPSMKGHAGDYGSTFIWGTLKGYIASDANKKGMDQDIMVTRCPGARVDWLWTSPEHSCYRYNAANGSNGKKIHAAGRRVSTITDPARAVLLFDMSWPNWPAKDLPHDGVNLVYADGHVEFMSAEEFLPRFKGNMKSELMTTGWE